MHRIDGAGATFDNKFTEGDPQTAVPATDVTDDWLNSLQEEVAYVIEQAGITLVKLDNTQLRAAILKMIQDAGKAVVIQNATFEASVANGEAVRWDAANSRFDEALADGTANNQAVGFADVTNSKVYCYGETPALFAGLTPGARYYLDATTAGAITTIPPSNKVFVGIAKSATTLFVDIDPSGSELKRKVGNFSRDMTLASGTQAVTGVGFQPKMVLLFAALSSVNAAMSFGFSDGTSNHCEFTRGSASFLSAQTPAIQLETTAGVDYQSGSVNSLDADGFTIGWTKGGAPTGVAVVNYLAIG